MQMGERYDPMTQEAVARPQSLCSYTWMSLLSEWRRDHQRGIQRPLISCMHQSVGLEATEFRDKVFALISLSADMDASIVDYSISPQDLTKQLAFHFIETDKGRSSDILSAAQMFKRLPGVPSWMPCWTESPNMQFYPLHARWSTGSAFNDGSKELVNRGVPDPNRGIMAALNDGALIIGSKAVDYITSLPQVAAEEIELEREIMPVRDLLDPSSPKFRQWKIDVLESTRITIETESQQAALVAGLITSYPNGVSVEECVLRSRFQDDRHQWSTEKFDTYVAFGRELMQDIIPNLLELAKIRSAREPQPSEPQHPCIENHRHKEEWRKLAERHDTAVLARLDVPRPLREIYPSRKLAVTAHGLIAWVPRTAEIGDAINVVDGTRIPILLRRDKEAPGKAEVELPTIGKVVVDAWNVIGDVYLHGFMTGPMEDAMSLMGWRLGEGKRHIELR